MRAKLDNILEYTLAILLSSMTLVVLWGVLTRYALGNQSSWTDELARFLLIWVGIMGAAYASGKNRHIAIDLLPQYLNAKNRRRLELFIACLIVLFVAVVFIVGGLRYVYISFILGQTSAALNISMGYIYLVLPISGACIIYYRLHDLRLYLTNANQ